MILPSTNPTIIQVRQALDYPSTSLGTLCTCDNVNEFARYRPGYWTVNTSGYLQFQKPRGSNYTDPRGYDGSGINLEVYKIGDFRNYNNMPDNISVFGDETETIILPSDYSSTYSTNVNISLGEVDWFGNETEYRGRNNLSAYTYVVAFNPNNIATIYGSVHKDNLETTGTGAGRHCRAIFPMTFNVPSTGTTGYTYPINFALSNDATHINARFPDEFKKIFIIKKVSSSYEFIVPQSAYATLFNSLNGLSSSDANSQIYDVQISNNTGQMTLGSTNINASNMQFIITMYPTYNRYRVEQLRWTVSGTIDKMTNSTVVSSENWNTAPWAINSSMGYSPIITMSTGSQDGYIYRVNLTTFGSTTVNPYS